MHQFKAILSIIGINPYISVPDNILTAIFQQVQKSKGPIPVCGTVNGLPYQQNLVRYKGEWRLYINTSMLKNSPKRIGETLDITITWDASDRTISPHPKLMSALAKNPKAQEKLESLPKSLQKEIIKYISSLKTEESIDRNVQRAIDFLLGKGSFIGRKNV